MQRVATKLQNTPLNSTWYNGTVLLLYKGKICCPPRSASDMPPHMFSRLRLQTTGSEPEKGAQM